MSDLEQKRRELEQRRQGRQERVVCVIHGEHATLVCPACYSLQQERVERESAAIRYDNTASALRRRVVEQTANLNGHG